MALTIDAGITEVNIFSVDLIEVVFGVNIRNSDNIRLPSSWQIDLLDATGRTVSVSAVRTDNSPSIDRVYLVVSKVSLGAHYCISVLGTVLSTQNETLVGTLQKIAKGRFTKTDSIYRTRPVIYDLRISANLRHVLNAIGRQDDLIGGSQNEGDEILPECPVIS